MRGKIRLPFRWQTVYITGKIKCNYFLVWGDCSLMLAYWITLKAMFYVAPNLMDVEIQVHNQTRGGWWWCCWGEGGMSCNMDHLRGKWKWLLPQAHSFSCVTFRFLSNTMLFSKPERTCRYRGLCFHNDKWWNWIYPKDYHNEKQSIQIFHYILWVLQFPHTV